MMMATIDRALNAIWEVKAERSLAGKFLVYWAILSLGPVLIGASILVTSYIVSLPILSEAASSGLGRRLLGLAPVVASAIAFTMVYALVPNRRVRAAHALAGGVFAAVLFEGAKRGFGLYITQFPTYEAACQNSLDLGREEQVPVPLGHVERPDAEAIAGQEQPPRVAAVGTDGPLTCDAARDVMGLLISSDAAVPEAAAARDHLAGCDECRAYVQRMQVPARLLVFHDANHWIMTPKEARYYWEEAHAWLAKYLQADDGDTAAR